MKDAALFFKDQESEEGNIDRRREDDGLRIRQRHVLKCVVTLIMKVKGLKLCLKPLVQLRNLPEENDRKPNKARRKR